MLLAYPDFFAAGIPCSAITPPTAAEVSKLCDTSVWMINCDIDFWAGAKTSSIKPVFNAIKKSSHRKDGVRLTSLSQVVLANGEKQGSGWRGALQKGTLGLPPLALPRGGAP